MDNYDEVMVLMITVIMIFQIVIVGSYLITSVFFSVYSMAVDTLFLCFRKSVTCHHSILTEC